MYKKVIGQKIRLAVAGCGRISRNHFAAIATGWERRSGMPANRRTL